MEELPILTGALYNKMPLAHFLASCVHAVRHLITCLPVYILDIPHSINWWLHSDEIQENYHHSK